MDWGTNNYINSNVSYRYTDEPNRFYGPYYGREAQDLYDVATRN